MAVDTDLLRFSINIFVIFSLSILTFVYLLLYIWPTPRSYRLIQKIKGPPGHFLLGNAIELAKTPNEDIITWLEDSMKKYNRIMRLWIVGTQHVLMNEPADVQIILSSMQHISKGLEYLFLSPWLDEGLLTSTGIKWQQRRKLLTPAFHFKILEDNILTINKSAKVLSEKFASTQGKEVNIEKFIPLCTLDVIGETAMGLKIDSQNDSTQKYVVEIKRITEMITMRVLQFWLQRDWLYYMTTAGKTFLKTKDSLHEFSYRVIKERRANVNKHANDEPEETGKKRRAFLDLLLEIDKTSPGVLTDKDIREEVDTFMFEGHDTTSSAITFSLFSLATHPDIQEKVYEEQFNIFGSSDREVTRNDLSKMTYLEKVIKETLRMYPSVPHFSRFLDKDLVLEDGLIIPSGTNVMVETYLIHHNEKHWPNPKKFDPERFSDEQNQQRHPYAFIPFSAGPRNCIGQKFAMMELKTVISTITRRLKIIPVTKKEDLKVTILLILRPTKPIVLKFVPR